MEKERKTIICADCKKAYSFDETAGYPRKYCENCSNARKESFNANKNGGNPNFPKVSQPPQAPRITDGHQMMLVSYAKDIFIVLTDNNKNDIEVIKVMNIAIELVKQAKVAFD